LLQTISLLHTEEEEKEEERRQEEIEKLRVAPISLLFI